MGGEGDGMFAEEAREKVETTNIGKTTEAFRHYSEGHLPPARILLRSQRYAVKLFLAHWHAVAYQIRYQHAPPKPYVTEHLGHVHLLSPPGRPLVEDPPRIQ